MKKNTLLLAIALFFISVFSVNAQADKLELFFKLSDYYLKRHVYKGLVNYQYSRDNFGEVELLYKTIGEIDLSQANEEELKAFYANTYNILVIYQIVQNYPLARPLDKEGFFDNTYHVVAGERLTLDQLEKGKMLGTYKDARFHFVLACGAISCPPLYNLAYKPANVDQLLDERTRFSVNDETFIRVNPRRKTVEVSEIFNWYKGDFERDGKTVLEFINQYREEKIPSNYKVNYYTYDWTLNERKL